ncbi:MAG TPA: hypothetical protein VK786_01780, partial [bacterium]|nr:hypothetical protein [bacterium]
MLKNFLAAVAFMAAPAWSHVSAPLTILAGSGVPGLADGQGTDAQFDSPTALSLSPSGPVLYVDDAGNTLIRSVTMGKAAQVASLSLDKNALPAAADPSEIVPFSGDGTSDRLAVLCLGGKRIMELSGLSGTAHSRVLYSGRALSQLTYMAGPKVFLALRQPAGDLMEAPYSPTRK